jgi:hypothetical protein
MNKENTQQQASLTSTHYSHDDDDDSFTNQDSYLPHQKAQQLLGISASSVEPRDTPQLTKQ